MLASLSIFCSLTASVSLRFCRNSARERRKRATLLGPSMLGVLKAVRERAWCTRACGRLRAVHKRLIRGRRACSYLLHDLPSVARRPYSAHAQQLSIESQRARHRAQAARSAPRVHTPLARAASRSPPAANSALSTGGEKRRAQSADGRGSGCYQRRNTRWLDAACLMRVFYRSLTATGTTTVSGLSTLAQPHPCLRAPTSRAPSMRWSPGSNH